MSDKYFVDTNILVYAHDATTGAKHERARTLIERLWHRSGVVSTQVLQELVVNLRRKAGTPVDASTARAIVTDYLAWAVNNGPSVLEALDVEKRHGLSFWNALIVQAAESAGAAVLYSEDLADAQRYRSVRVVNPFRQDPPLTRRAAGRRSPVADPDPDA
jgi:predicted nucleic acid-binding protein